MTIICDDELGGDARIEGHRIAVYHIMDFVEAGFTVEEIAEDFDLKVEEVEEAIEYAESEL